MNSIFLTHRLHALIAGSLSCLLWLSVGGCGKDTTSTETVETAVGEPPEIHDDHDHEGHHHDAPGPHGGHIVVLDPGHHHVEWVHLDEEDVVEVYLGSELAETAKKVQMLAVIQGEEPVVYDLEPATDELGAGGYQLTSPNLLTQIEMSDGVATHVTLVVDTDNGTLKAPITDDHDHDHDH